MLQQAGRFVLDVIHPGRGRVGLAEEGHSAMEIPAVVADDRPRDPGLRGGGFHLPVHHFPRRFGHRLQVDQFHVLVTQAAVPRIPRGLAETDDDQAFPLAQLHRVVQDPNPVARLLFGAVQLVEAQPQQPQPHAIVRAHAASLSPPTPIQGQHLGHAFEVCPRTQYQGQTACHHAQRELVTRNLRGEVLRTHQSQIPRGAVLACRGGCFLVPPPRPAPGPSSDRDFPSSWPSTVSDSCFGVWPPCTSPSTYPGFGGRR
jgi:hypothetical protein